MKVGWVGASVRARLLLRRRVGRERAIQLARGGSLREALVGLTGTAYGRQLEPGMNLETAQRALAATTLLHLRLLSGWLPPGRAEFMRALAAWYELANVEDRLAYVHGAELRPPFHLGGLASAWPRASQAVHPGELRAALASSAWGDPGGDTTEQVHLGLRVSWGARMAATVPEAGDLVAGALALFVGRELFVTGRPIELLLSPHVPAIGSAWMRARTFAELAAGLPGRAAWVLEGIAEPEHLWRAEIGWWTRAEKDGRELVRVSREGQAVVTGVVLLLAADTWRTACALAAADRGGADLEEVLDPAA